MNVAGILTVPLRSFAEGEHIIASRRVVVSVTRHSVHESFALMYGGFRGGFAGPSCGGHTVAHGKADAAFGTSVLWGQDPWPSEGLLTVPLSKQS